MSENNRTPLERCFDRVVEMLNLERIVAWISRKFGNEIKDGSEILLEMARVNRQHQPVSMSFEEGGIVSAETLRLLRQTPADLPFSLIPPLELSNAQQDVINTIDSMRNAFRAQGFPIYEGNQDENGNYEYQIAWSGVFNKESKKPLMDRKYPHVCYECEKDIQYKHAFSQACTKYNFGLLFIKIIKGNIYDKKRLIKEVKEGYEFRKQFKKMWKSTYFHFFCCDCFRLEGIQLKYFEDVNKEPIRNNLPIEY